MGYSKEDHVWVLCAYKESEYLEECVLSILAQTVDTGLVITTSTPCRHISDTAEKYGLKLLINPERKGIGSDWNFAFNNTGSRLVTIAHQDDVYAPDYVENMLDYLNNSADPIIFFSAYRELRGGKTSEDTKLLKIKREMLLPLRVRAFWNSRFWRRRILSFGSPICCPSVTYVRNKVMGSLFSTRMQSNLDWDQWERLSQKDGAFVYCPKPLMSHRIHEDSETSRLINNRKRTEEDLEMFGRFWPRRVARILEHYYVKSQDNNQISKKEREN